MKKVLGILMIIVLFVAIRIDSPNFTAFNLFLISAWCFISAYLFTRESN